ALQKYADSWLEQEGVEALLKSAKYLSNFYPKDYTVRTFAGMVNAAFGTASSLTSGLFLELAKDTRLVDEAGQSLSRGEGKLSVNEFIRYISPAQATNRVVVNSCEISGTKLQKGDTVVTLIASANRDENIFERPNQIIPGRKNNRHLAFAAGPHLCLGRRLAEAWGQEVIKRLVNNMDKFSVDIDSILYADSATARSLSKLPVERIV
ncbi:cytochrome P450, partial [Rothia sp. CCM 9416]|uniref:cytochrome P450 n=1 Tax=Rothia sp. CCM 9416 TaxID=3402655 RepID=UPI003AD9393A